VADPPRWASRLTFALALVGLGLSGYLTWEHYSTGATLSCPSSGVVNCLKVTTSAQSKLGGLVPVALLGTLYFAAMSALCAPRAWTVRSTTIARLRLAGAVSGIGFVLYLVAVELVVVHAICLWCTAVHVVTFGLFLVVLAAFLQLGQDDGTKVP
jgi:uncharacterized membrane protein